MVTDNCKVAGPDGLADAVRHESLARGLNLTLAPSWGKRWAAAWSSSGKGCILLNKLQGALQHRTQQDQLRLQARPEKSMHIQRMRSITPCRRSKCPTLRSMQSKSSQRFKGDKPDAHQLGPRENHGAFPVPGHLRRASEILLLQLRNLI